jgi:hypothetical protein
MSLDMIFSSALLERSGSSPTVPVLKFNVGFNILYIVNEHFEFKSPKYFKFESLLNKVGEETSNIKFLGIYLAEGVLEVINPQLIPLLK